MGPDGAGVQQASVAGAQHDFVSITMGPGAAGVQQVFAVVEVQQDSMLTSFKSFTSLSRPNRSHTIPATTARANTNILYTRVTLHPNKVRKSPMIMGFKTGEVNKNDILAPKGAPAFSKPTKTGIVEQEQNGVRAPKKAPKILPMTLRGRCNTPLIFSSGINS